MSRSAGFFLSRAAVLDVRRPGDVAAFKRRDTAAAGKGSARLGERDFVSSIGSSTP
ncbi:MAG: hypothetical protein WD766_01170 [Gemmatimonadota bacterium]